MPCGGPPQLWMFVAMCLTLFFVVLEIIEISQSGNTPAEP